VVVRVGDRDQRRQVEDGLAALHGCIHCARVGDITRQQLDLSLDLGGQVGQKAGRAARVIVYEGPQAVASPHQRFGQVRADKATGSGQ
jgi:hypothetical protein